jgi:PhoPQ-activated pathogenicity-related protein
VERFVVAGRSKRGWTAWTTALVDPRVVGVVPMVIYLLNVDVSFQHQHRVYGAWSPAIRDYVDLGIPGWLGSERFQELRRVVDPYEHRARLTLPKLVINAAGDEYFLPDGSRFYFADLPGEKHLRAIPNTGHSLGATDADETLLAFHQALATGAPRPRFTWSFLGDDGIQVRLQQGSPTAVRLWQAHNPAARNFSLTSIGRTWQATLLPPEGGGVYTARVGVPEVGWSAFFVELTFAADSGPPLILTSEVRVVPDTFP